MPDDSTTPAAKSPTVKTSPTFKVGDKVRLIATGVETDITAIHDGSVSLTGVGNRVNVRAIEKL